MAWWYATSQAMRSRPSQLCCSQHLPSHGVHIHPLSYAPLAALLMLVTSLQAAVNNMTNELMLLGVATLILSACQKDIGSICSEFSARGVSGLKSPAHGHGHRMRALCTRLPPL